MVPIRILGRQYLVPPGEPQRTQELYRLLGILVEENKRQMMARGVPPRPAIAVRGLRYQRERGEHWQTANELAKSLRGDCEDLACYEAARLQLAGIPARPALLKNSLGWHVVVGIPRVRVGYGVVKSVQWDPSEALGMGDE